MENQTFFCDIYGYENYNWEELTEEFLNEGKYITCDAILETNTDFVLNNNAKEVIESYEKEGTLITEMFIKQRVLRDNPIFKHIMNWGKIKIELI